MDSKIIKHEKIGDNIEIYQADCNARDYSSWKTYEDYLIFAGNFLTKSYLALKDSGRIAINIPDGYNRNPWIPIYADYCKLMQKTKFVLRGNIVWHKMSGGGKTSWGSWRSSSNPCIIDEHEMIIVAHKKTPKIEHGSEIEKEEFFDSIHSIWKIKPETSRKHPAPYPIELPLRLIRFLSGQNSVIVDPFMGSGTTGLACIETKRRFIGIEKSEQYYEMAKERIKRKLMQKRLF